VNGRVLTVSGRCVDLTALRPEDISLTDIAHALSQICRWTGHTSRFYSVAEHCVHVSHLVPPRAARAALLHDAAEAYLSDLSRPVKQLRGLEGYVLLERQVDAVVRTRFELPTDRDTAWEVDDADLRMMCIEARQLMGVGNGLEAGFTRWIEPPAEPRALGWAPELARTVFLARARELVVQ
jgi:5'-deoxynucleotidase YfbR-like HD superfamily hydrolase